ncbi:MAG: asparagine synthase-related protein, partial [Actinomycetes bacterium]
MLDRLVHRGPDDVGSLTTPNAWLGHTRLSIVDVGGGHQPLCTGTNGADGGAGGAGGDRGTGGAAIVVNGEIYNHTDLRPGLEGVTWQTSSDSEVALHILDREGPAGLARLRGMFALAFTDGVERFVLARDPVGIKPLYWARHGGRVVAASELKAFDPGIRSHVEAFPPGHYWTPQTGLVRFATAVSDAVRRAPVAGVRAAGAPPVGHGARIRQALVTAVERRMMGDVPVGCFLSGGLDSSVVAAIASRWMARRGRQLQTFAVGTVGSSDLAAARVVAAALGTDHHELVCTPAEVLAAVPAVVRAIEHFD